MNNFAKRRSINSTVFVIVSLISWFLFSVLETSIRATSFWTGWLLFFLVTTLALFNGRKKLPFLPLGTAASWMQYHIYAGLFSIVVFFAHTGAGMPSGILESSLSVLFVLIALSGVLGLILSRLIPVGLTTRGEPVLFERIPTLRMGLQSEVEELVVCCARDNQTTTISDFYTNRLEPFFRAPSNLSYHLLGWSRPMRELEREIAAMDRYLNDDERRVIAEILELAQLKDDLDYQWARQLVLKGWLFIHIPLTFSLLILLVLHIFVAYGFRGNLP
ncbi:MAG: hypothetical protein IH881_15810 [Myxococcales bacterium]|nr:hypothetical protein [Myxococcales bacterium]MCH7869161.1 hypothetical protein [Myxococcales bacterium]